MTTSREPCGNLPVYTVSVHAFYCARHQAWSTHATRYSEDGLDEPWINAQFQQQFGPFDDAEDVCGWMVKHAEELMHLPLSPGHRCEPIVTDVPQSIDPRTSGIPGVPDRELGEQLELG